MRKFTVTIQEQITRTNTYEVEAEGESQIDLAMYDIDWNAVHPDDVEQYFTKYGVGVLEVTEGFEECDYECEDYYEITDGEEE